MPLGGLAALFGVKEKPAPVPPAEPGTPTGPGQIPDALPVRVKRYFFSQDENAFFRSLEESLAGTPYRVFPNVHLEDLFTITDQAKHADFLIVDVAQDFRPVLAIELDGKSHQRERQQYNDGVKDVIFRSAGLPLYRLESRKYRPEEIVEKVKQAAAGG